jgi:hypothetical protein
MVGFRNLLVLTLFGSLTNFGYSLDGPRSFVRRVKESEKKDDIRRLLSSKTKSGASQRKVENTLPELNNVVQIIQHSVQEHLSRHMSTLESNRKLQSAAPNVTEDTLGIIVTFLESIVSQLIFWVLCALTHTIIAILLAAYQMEEPQRHRSDEKLPSNRSSAET